MGERKGVNKYYPPDYDPRKGGLNKFQGTHALRERARKLHMGILIIRFEMPYNIWCEGCENHIGTGVRYNAEKKKVGMYYSTPIYQFRMKCHLCDNHFEIKTDPANLDYEIVSGARRQERRWDPTENEQVVPEDKEVTRKMAVDAMFKLEHGVDDKEKSKQMQASIEQLEEFQSRRWHNDYAANKALRDTMRVRRTKEQDQAARDASYHLEVPLLPPNEDDTKTAKLLQFTQAKTSEQLRKEKRGAIDAQSVFAKFKSKSISPVEKKAFARQSLEGIITNSQKNVFKSKNSIIKPQNLGVVVKKVDQEVNVENGSDVSIEDTASVVCKCNLNVKPDRSDDSDVNSASSSCDNCGCNSRISEGNSTAVSESKEYISMSSAADSHSQKISVTCSETSIPDCSETSIPDNSSPVTMKNKVQSLVGYDYSESDSD